MAGGGCSWLSSLLEAGTGSRAVGVMEHPSACVRDVLHKDMVLTQETAAEKGTETGGDVRCFAVVRSVTW